jgi:hypothetical protein
MDAAQQILNGKIQSILLGNLIAPLIVGIVGWVIKDVIVDLYKVRQKEIREERLFRLREFYCPLFFWSGVALFDASKSKQEFGLQQLSALLEKGASLLPIQHYHVFIKLVERLAGQPTAQPLPDQIQKARDYVYSQIELLNFVLFRQSDDFDPKSDIDIFRTLKRVLRIAMSGAIQLALWVVSIVLVYFVYYIATSNPVALTFTGLLFFLILVAEAQRRRGLAKAMELRMKR